MYQVQIVFVNEEFSFLSWFVIIYFDLDISNLSNVAYVLQELGFDYLRDNLSRNKEQLVMRWYLFNCPLTSQNCVCLLNNFSTHDMILQAKTIPFCYRGWSGLGAYRRGKKSIADKWRGFITFEPDSQYCFGFPHLWILNCDVFNQLSCILTRIIGMQPGILLPLKLQNFLWRVLWVFSCCYKLLHGLTVKLLC